MRDEIEDRQAQYKELSEGGQPVNMKDISMGYTVTNFVYDMVYAAYTDEYGLNLLGAMRVDTRGQRSEKRLCHQEW